MYQPEMVSQAVRGPAFVSPGKTLKGSVDLLSKDKLVNGMSV